MLITILLINMTIFLTNISILLYKVIFRKIYTINYVVDKIYYNCQVSIKEINSAVYSQTGISVDDEELIPKRKYYNRSKFEKITSWIFSSFCPLINIFFLLILLKSLPLDFDKNIKKV